MTLSAYQISLLRTSLEYFIDAKKDEIKYDWVAGVHDDAIESCKVWIADAWDVDLVLSILYREAITDRGDGQ